jgi:UDP-N-acetylglucosamine 1-carboxyvinyltransferase
MAFSVPGGKNIAMPIIGMVAALRTAATISNVPRIADVDAMLSVLSSLGARVRWADGSHDVWLDASSISRDALILPFPLPNFRGAIYLSAVALTCREGTFDIAVGGDKISDRTLFPHARAIRSFGHIVHSVDANRIRFSPGNDNGLDSFVLDDKGISASCLALSLAMCRRGKTRIQRCSLEHEVSDFIGALRCLGAKVYRKGRSVCISSRNLDLNHQRHHVIVPSDLITAGTALVSGMMRSEAVKLQMIGPAWRGAWLASIMAACGADVRWMPHGVIEATSAPSRGFRVRTGFPPHLPADLQPLFTVLALRCPRTSILEDFVYSNRFDHVPCLASLGARISRSRRKLTIRPSSLRGSVDVSSLGIREQAAVKIAELAYSVNIRGEDFRALWRGYERDSDLTKFTFGMT